jgi:hypothetical protein
MVHALQLTGLSSLVHDSAVCLAGIFAVIKLAFHMHVQFLPKIIVTGVLLLHI